MRSWGLLWTEGKLWKRSIFSARTDISMPVMGGMELIKAVRDNYPSTVIVIVSGYSDFAYAQQAIRYGVSNYLLKPLENDSLIETLFDIKKSLSYFAARSQRHIFYSDRYEMESPYSCWQWSVWET